MPWCCGRLIYSSARRYDRRRATVDGRGAREAQRVVTFSIITRACGFRRCYSDITRPTFLLSTCSPRRNSGLAFGRGQWPRRRIGTEKPATHEFRLRNAQNGHVVRHLVAQSILPTPIKDGLAGNSKFFRKLVDPNPLHLKNLGSKQILILEPLGNSQNCRKTLRYTQSGMCPMSGSCSPVRYSRPGISFCCGDGDIKQQIRGDGLILLFADVFGFGSTLRSPIRRRSTSGFRVRDILVPQLF